ncbi:MAG: hypothetical protein WD063_00290 [Pirellulales bacterium]
MSFDGRDVTLGASCGVSTGGLALAPLSGAPGAARAPGAGASEGLAAAEAAGAASQQLAAPQPVSQAL